MRRESTPLNVPPMQGLRLDKWLWAARFFKTRGLASDQIAKGRVRVNGQPAKASREVHLGDRVELLQGHVPRAVLVKGLSQVRGAASVAQAMYEETAASVALRGELAARRGLAAEPALAIGQGRPTKRDRRQLALWNRWSASVEAD